VLNDRKGPVTSEALTKGRNVANSAPETSVASGYCRHDWVIRHRGTRRLVAGPDSRAREWCR